MCLTCRDYIQTAAIRNYTAAGMHLKITPFTNGIIAFVICDLKTNAFSISYHVDVLLI